jgi:thiol-disulfide isomerase/thioredoxin
VITVSAAQDFTAGKLAVALAYAIGSGAVLYLLMLGGRRVAERLKPWRGRIQVAMGAAMVLVALAMSAELDLEFQSAIADDLPSLLVNPSGGLEGSDAVSDDLAALGGIHGATAEGGVAAAEAGAELPDYGAAPDFVDPGEWFNTEGGSLSIEQLTGAGRVVLVDFWTYTCINCIRTLPYLTAWDEQYRDDGLTIVGVHAPEFAFERDAGNVADAIERNAIEYPVVQDNEFGTWNAFANQYWPAKYLIDADGEIRLVHFGEGAYEETEAAIRSLLAESGDERLGARALPGETERADRNLRSPETYLGTDRAFGFVESPREGVHTYAAPEPGSLDVNQFAYGGSWDVDRESATAGSRATLALGFQARRVFLVLGADGAPRELDLLLDGRPLPERLAGEDVSAATATIGEQRLYRLVDLPLAGRHTLELRFEPQITGYAFTFG